MFTRPSTEETKNSILKSNYLIFFMNVRTQKILSIGVLTLGLVFSFQSSVSAQTKSRILISPSASSMTVGQSKSFIATDDPNECAHLSGCPGSRNVTSGTTWSTSDPTVLSHVGGGMFRAHKTGSAIITARYQSYTGTASVSVTSGNNKSTTTPQGGLRLDKILIEMPGWDNFRGNSSGLGLVEWLGGRFIVSGGSCHQNSEDHGTWVFQENGALIQERHFCEDALASGEDADELDLWSHMWGISPKIIAINNNQFVRQGSRSGWNYSPILYEIENSSVSLIAKVFDIIADPEKSDNPPRSYNKEDAPLIEDVARTDNMLIAVRENKNILYSLPNLTRVKEWSLEVHPIVGIGEYLIGWKRAGGKTTTNVYRLNNNELVFVQTLFNTRPVGLQEYSRDPSNPNRIAVKEGANKARVYTVGSTGLTETGIVTDIESGFAIFGNSVAKSKDSKLEIYSGNTKTASVVLPDEDMGNGSSRPAPDANGMSFNATGSGLVVVNPYGAYLYALTAGSQTPQPLPSNPFQTPPLNLITSIPISSDQDYMTFAQSYIRVLQALVDASAGKATSTSSITASSKTDIDPDNEGSSYETDGGSQLSTIFDQYINRINSY